MKKLNPTPFKTNSLTGMKYHARDFYNPLMLQTMLELVCPDKITTGRIETWTYKQKHAAFDWAIREHLSASDNNNRRTVKPDFL